MRRVPHPSGVDVVFDAKWHQYKVGHTALRSVSKVLDKYFPFDEKRVLALVSKKTGQPVEDVKALWNRQALLGKNIHEYIETKLRGLPPPTWTLLLKRQQQQAAAAAAAAKEEPVKKKRGRKKKKAAAAAEADEKERGEAASLSTASSQSTVDALLHGEEAAYMKAADGVIETILGNYDVIAVEQVIASPSWGIGGTVDLIARNKRTQKLFIGDWKTSSSVASAFRFGSFETPCTGCLMHLPNTKFYRYAMQVIIYGEILKHERYLSDGFFGRAVKPVDASVKGITVSSRSLHSALEYGIVQLSKNEEGGVCVEFKEVTEGTVLPVDARDFTFRELLKNVMRG
ncbi:uncharacterized protein Tco025E_05530 [Trypanosoma conorhini]|uniref:PD-(D/E)XK endonuclease-like domain-containing protein n=1 Tax=Trypanosoma conorhini TaxID=83891 RepID=A0A3R7PAB2_9TRYP|nr:uncharacterized protein Tco025E_05530 [Trypanosoma conorhini]RNF15427.1 hypothetical protein Tco025E_05530 [Trypanosoma conorhini]